MATTVISTQRVADYATWRTEFDAGSSMRAEVGVNIRNVYQSINDTNTVTIIAEVENPDVANALFNSPEMQEVMKKAGVLETVEVKMLNATH